MSKKPLQRRIAPGVSVTLEYPEGPIEFKLAFNNFAIAAIEESIGINLLANPYLLFGKVDKHRLGILFWAALLQDRPELEDKEGIRTARSFLDTPVNELKAFDAVWQAYLLYLPKEQAEHLKRMREEAERGEENPTKPAATADAAPAEDQNRPTGSSSGPSAESASA